jgi:hypothetical protein
MKWVYTFNINRKKEVEVTETLTGEKGEEITTKKKEEKVVPVQFALRKPNRRTYDNAELFYGVKLSEGIKAGLLTKTQLAKRYDNDGGPFSLDQKKNYSTLLVSVFEKESEVQKLQLNLDNLSEKEKKEKLTSNLIELTELREQMREFEVFHSSIFDQTAEGRAKNTSIMWWVLFSSYWKEEESSKLSPVFDGESFETKIDSYDELEEKDDPFWNEVISKLAYFVGFWYSGRATNQEEFEEIERLYDVSVFEKDEEEVPEEAPEETEEASEEESPKEEEATEKNDKTEES